MNVLPFNSYIYYMCRAKFSKNYCTTDKKKRCLEKLSDWLKYTKQVNTRTKKLLTTVA